MGILIYYGIGLLVAFVDFYFNGRKKPRLTFKDIMDFLAMMGAWPIMLVGYLGLKIYLSRFWEKTFKNPFYK